MGGGGERLTAGKPRGGADPSHRADADVLAPAAHVSDRSWPLTDPMRFARAERQQAVAQIHRSQKAWRAAAAGGHTRAGNVAIPEGGGSGLSAQVRSKMEPQLGGDLSAVKVHTSASSQQAAADLGARAFTVGNDIHFGGGEFAPGSKEGDKLLAHELTHVVQGQRSAAATSGARVGRKIHRTKNDDKTPKDEKKGDGPSPMETKIIAEAVAILSDPQFKKLEAAFKAKQTVTVTIHGRTIQYEPSLPASGMTNFPSGFLLGRECFPMGRDEVIRTVLHELYRLTTSKGADGVDKELANRETKAALDFSQRAFAVVKGQVP